MTLVGCRLTPAAQPDVNALSCVARRLATGAFGREHTSLDVETLVLASQITETQ